MSDLFPPWLLFALASAFFAALTAILGKIGVQEMNANLATFVRTVVILGVTALSVTVSGAWQRPTQLSGKGLTALLLSGVATGLSWMCYYYALQKGPASRVAPVDKLSVVLVIVFAAVFLGEAMSWRVWLGAGLVAGGAVLIALQ